MRALLLLAALAAAAPLKRSDFPKTFLWGAATAAYQVEGDNRGSDLWDWERRQGWEPSGPAVDSLHRWPEDLRELQELGANAYRFSIEWGRVLPEPGKPDEEALAYYGKLIDGVRRAGLRPVVTLHHFTNPAWFWKRHPEGWRDPGAVEDYLDYVRLVDERFGAKVSDWLTFNEPMVFLLNGYIDGHFPPGERGVLRPLTSRLMPAAANLIRAHRAARRLLKASAARRHGQARVGLAQNISWVEPASASAKDVEAARRWDEFFHWGFIDAAASGRIDLDLDGKAETALDEDGPGLDYLGVNYYTRIYVRAFPFVLSPVHAFPFHAEIQQERLGRLLFWLAGGRVGPGPKDEYGHEVYPDGLRLVCVKAWKRYGLPIMITENGVVDSTDAMRADYIRGHLAALKATLDAGVPLIGYMYWSLMDNYEWGSYQPRAGLYKVDRSTLERSATAGGRVYSDFLHGR